MSEKGIILPEPAKGKGSPGRKPKFTKEIIVKLEEVFLLGGSAEEACMVADISPTTFYKHIKEDPELAERFDTLKMFPILKARRAIVRSLDNPEYAYRFLEKKMKKEFGAEEVLPPNQLVNYGTVNSFPISSEKVTPAIIERVRQAKENGELE
jgi:hypothetical protein